MSGIYEQHLAEQERDGFNTYLSKLVECDDISDAAVVGITKQVIASGFESLSDKQKYRFGKDVLEAFPQPKCSRCEALIPFEEAYEHIHELSYCSSCQHDWNKMESE